jgi:hypothetical protein
MLPEGEQEKERDERTRAVKKRENRKREEGSECPALQQKIQPAIELAAGYDC